MGSGDIQSLADLGNGYEVVRTMRIAPIAKEAILERAATTLIPIAPLLLTMMPLEELLKKLVGILSGNLRWRMHFSPPVSAGAAIRQDFGARGRSILYL